MLKISTLVLASAALLAAVPAAAAQYSSPDSYDQSAPNEYNSAAPNDQFGNDQQRHHHRQNGGMGMSREQKAAWRAEVRQQVRNMPREERKAYREKIKAQWRAMDPSERRDKLTEIQNRWNAMPADQQQRLLARVSKHQGHRNRDQAATPQTERQNGNSQPYQDNGQYRQRQPDRDQDGDEAMDQ